MVSFRGCPEWVFSMQEWGLALNGTGRGCFQLCRHQAHPEPARKGGWHGVGSGVCSGSALPRGMTGGPSPARPRRPLEAARLDRVPEDVLLPVAVLGGSEPPAGFRLHQGGGVQRGAGDRRPAAHVRHPQNQQGECHQAGPHPGLKHPVPGTCLTQATGQTCGLTHRQTDTGHPPHSWTQVDARPTPRLTLPGCRGQRPWIYLGWSLAKKAIWRIGDEGTGVSCQARSRRNKRQRLL